MIGEIDEKIFVMISQLEEDHTVPKNIKIKLQNASEALKANEMDMALKIDKALQELDEIAEDNNLPDYTRTQIWSIVSMLESIK